MEYRNLGNSGLKVSAVGLGCNNFGFRLNEQESVNIIHHALDQGINYLDTANWYSQRGLSEQYIGKATQERRSDVIIATKFGMDMGGINNQGNSRNHILNAVEGSLKRLNTDYIDLYQIHRPDPATPIEETLMALDMLVRSGKVRYIGCSNFAAWQLADARWIAQVKNLVPLITIQSEYNLLNRTLEKEIVPCCLAHQVGVIPWGPLAGGLLSGKYERAAAAPSGSRVGMMALYQGNFNQANFDKLDALKVFAQERNRKLSDIAIAWLLAHPHVSSVIAGATRTEQITDNIAGVNYKITQEEMTILNQITADKTGEIAFGDKAQPKK